MATLSSFIPWEKANPIWAAIINPFIKNPLNSAKVFNQLSLNSGVNTIAHGLGQVQRGWFFTDSTAAFTCYRSAPFNNTTLTLTCSAPAIVDLAVF